MLNGNKSDEQENSVWVTHPDNQNLTSNNIKWRVYAVPLAILITGFLISGAILYSGNSSVSQSTTEGVGLSQGANTGTLTRGIRPVGPEDHIRGDRNAPIKMIVYSDLECPFCKRFHTSMQLLMDDYGNRGQVAWVYRHFPLDSIHSKARKEAQATECANELGGDDAFWEYTDRLYEITPSNNQLDLSLLPKIADEIGLSRTKFEDCLSGDARGGKYAAHIEDDYQDALRAGGTGTPHSVIIAPDGKMFPIIGAQSYTALSALMKLALEEK